MIDSLAVYKDAEGGLEVEHLSNLTGDEAKELGRTVGALIGLGIEGEEGAVAGAIAGEEAAAEGDGYLDEAEAWDVARGGHPARHGRGPAADRAPLGRAAARRDRPRGRFRVSDGFISPLDLVEIGLVSAEEADELHRIETAGAAPASS